MARWGTWTLYDPQLDESWIFDIGPREAADLTFPISEDLSFVDAAGHTVILERTEAALPAPVLDDDEPFPDTFTFTNLSTTQQTIETLIDWSTRPHSLELTDIHGRRYNVMIVEFDHKRTAEQTGVNPWVCEWTMTFDVFNVLAAAS